MDETEIDMILCYLLAAADVFSVKDHYTKREVMVSMRDGVRLFTSIYEPKDGKGPYPIILQRTPYGSGPYGAEKFPLSLGPCKGFAEEGYVFVIQDVRGRYMSEGKHIYCVPHIPNKKAGQVDESSDAYDTVDWLTKNVPNFNGKVGVWGISQPGFYASHSAIDAHPAVVAVSPQAPVTDRFVGDDDHRHGAFTLVQRFGFMASFGRPHPVPATEYGPSFRVPFDSYRFFLNVLPIADATKYLGADDQYWKQITDHGTYDDFWKSRGVEQHLKEIKPATLVIGGLFDAEDLYGALHTYGAIAKQSPQTEATLVMGPWSHGGWASGVGDRLGDLEFGDAKTGEDYRSKVALPWFNYQLKGGPKPELPRAMIFNTGVNVWRQFDAWPPNAGTLTDVNLSAGGGLTLGRANSGVDEYTSDPARPVPYTATVGSGVPSSFMTENQRFAFPRPDVLTYFGEPLAQDTTIAGPIQADLKVSTSGTDCDFVVKVIDMYPEDARGEGKMAGYMMPVRMDVMRAKFRGSLENAKPMPPNKATRVAFEMPDVCHTFKKGHRMVIQIQSTWFPLIDRNPGKFCDIYHAQPSDYQRATQRVFCGGSDGSKLTFRVLPQ
jgi:uncharacterized protein